MRWIAAIAVLLNVLAIGFAAAAPIGNDAFERTWARTDKPVADHSVARTWMWGPAALSPVKQEEYSESPGGQRTVQYFDKSRMEITIPDADPNSVWYVTNGLLVVELTTGRMQVGNNNFVTKSPAAINVAGDGDDPDGPTYATMAAVRDAAPLDENSVITQWISRSGAISVDAGLAQYGIMAAHHVQVPGLNHVVAGPFWEFMNSSGAIWDDDHLENGQLFSDPFYATGYPITEAYWAYVKVGGTKKWVLMQCFERRCLTYTPGNPEGFQTEAGNVGQHYYIWRYGSLPPQPVEFGDGSYFVGQDIPPGTYRNSSSDAGCYWERLSGFSGELDDIIANDFVGSGRTIVTIGPSDLGFKSDRCGTWSNDLSPITSSPTAPFSDGTYQVGSEVAPGLWRNSDSSEGCYWERVSGFGGEFDEILANNFTNSIDMVEIRPGDVGFVSHRCGLWTKVG